MKRFITKVLSALTAAAMLVCSMGGVSAWAHQADYDYSGVNYVGDKYAYMMVDLSDSDIYVGDSSLAYANIYTNIKHGPLYVKWKSNNESVATVTGDGVVAHIKGRSAGEATIYAYLYYGDTKMDTRTVDVRVEGAHSTYVPVTGISINQSNVKCNVGVTGKFTATVYPSNASNKEVYWSSNDATVVQIDDDGDARAVGEGNAVIIARTAENGFVAYCNVTVTDPSHHHTLPVTAVHVTPSTTTLGVGQSINASATVYPQEAANKNVIWNSANPNIAVVDSNGRITAVAPGNATINCITVDGGKMDSIYLTVVSAGSSAKITTLPTMPVAAVETRDPAFNYKVVSEIVAAPKNGVVLINAEHPMSYDKSVATALAQRPDVTLTCSYPFTGHTYCMALAPGYNLSKDLDSTGYVEWLELAKKPGVAVAIAN